MNAEHMPHLYPRAWDYLAARRIELSPVFYARIDALRAKAWTVSRLQTLEHIQAVKDALWTALREQKTFSEWQKSLSPEALALSKAHRETIFRNAIQSSYNGAKWAQFRENPRVEVLMYRAIGDHRTRPNHRALNGLMMPKDDPRWAVLSPPCGHRCRCTLVALSKRQLERLAYQGAPTELPKWTDAHGVQHHAAPDAGWRQTPENADLFKLLREKEKALGMSPAVFQPEAAKSAKSLPISSLLQEKIAKAKIKAADFSGMVVDLKEVKRLQDEGLRFSEAQLANKWQQYYSVSLRGFDASKHKFLTRQPPDMVEVNPSIPEAEWRTLDIMFTLEPHANHREFLHGFNKSAIAWDKKKKNIIKHLKKADIVPMYMAHFDNSTAIKIIDFVLSLTPKEREKIVFIWEGEP